MERWFHPNIGSDIVGMFTRSGAWRTMRFNMDVFGFYVQSLTAESSDVIGGNLVEALTGVDAFRWLLRNKISCAVEGGLFKEGQDTESNYRRLLSARRNVLDAGGWLDYVVLDEPLRAGQQDGESPRRAEAALLRYVLRLKTFFNVTLIEPYPFFDLDEWIARVIPLAAESGCNGLHIDVDLQHVLYRDGSMYSRKMMHDVQNITDRATDVGLEAGLIVTGNAAVRDRDATVSSAEYVNAAVVAALRYAMGMNTKNIRRMVVQSWHRNGEDTSIPRNAPEHLDLFGEVVEIFTAAPDAPTGDRTAPSKENL